MTLDIAMVLGVIALAVVTFVSERPSIDTVAMLAMGLFMVTGILTLMGGFGRFQQFGHPHGWCHVRHRLHPYSSWGF